MRAREQAMRDAQAHSEQRARELQERMNSERAVARQSLARVGRDEWWDRAGAEEIGVAWETANAWRDVDRDAAHTVEQMRDQLRGRYGIDPDSLDVAPTFHGPRPRRSTSRAAVRIPREAQKCSSPRDRAVALVPFYAGTRIAEIVGLDIDDVRLSARKGILRILGKGEKIREIPINPDLRAALSGWIHERTDWPGADTPALFLNQRGGRLSVKGAHDIITAIATAAGLEDDEITAHVYADLVVMPRLAGSCCSGRLGRRGCRHIQRFSRNLSSVSWG